MHDSFEFREDFHRSNSAAGNPVVLCPVKWEAAKACIEYVRISSVAGGIRARQLADLLDQVGITPEFEPSEVASGGEPTTLVA
jgi:hypothetical protein